MTRVFWKKPISLNRATQNIGSPVHFYIFATLTFKWWRAEIYTKVIYEDLIWGFFPVDLIKIYCINLIHLIQGARGHWVELDHSLESFLESQQRPGRTSKKSATQKCQKHFSNNLRGCVVPQRWHCILFRTGTQAWKLDPSSGFHFERSFSSVSRPAYSSSNRCSSTVMS